MTATNREFMVVKPEEGRAVHMSGDTYTFKAVKEQTDGLFTLFEGLVPPEGGPPPHIHHIEDESFYLLTGELEFMADKRMYSVAAGSFVYVPRGLPHAFKNVSREPAKMLLLFTPGGVEGLFFEVGQPAPKGTTARPVDDDEVARLLAASPRYHLEVLPPS